MCELSLERETGICKANRHRKYIPGSGKSVGNDVGSWDWLSQMWPVLISWGSWGILIGRLRGPAFYRIVFLWDCVHALYLSFWSTWWVLVKAPLVLRAGCLQPLSSLCACIVHLQNWVTCPQSPGCNVHLESPSICCRKACWSVLTIQF